MKIAIKGTALGLLAVLTACGSGGNIKTAADYGAPNPPAVRYPTYQAYAAYGQTPAIWHPPVIDRSGTIVSPTEPATSWDRPDYEGAVWAQRAGPSAYGGPAGTF